MKTLRETKVKICMLILILLIQVASPLLTIMVENSFTLTTLGVETEETTWDVSANEDGSVTAVLDEEGTLTITGTGAMKDWSSKSNVSWYTIRTKIKKAVIGEGVTSIGDYAFHSCSNLIEITLSETINDIGYYTFVGCTNLKEIIIPKNVTEIKEWAFFKCENLEQINIPSGVTNIGEYAFEYCTSLKNINVEDNNTKYCSENGILYNKDKTKIICYPAGKTETNFEIPKGITKIENGAFVASVCLKSIKISDTVIDIGEYAFLESSALENITIPKNVISIGKNAFASISTLKNINVENSNTSYSSADGVLYNKEKTKIICYPAGKNDTQIAILSGITSIEDYAFRGCKNIEKIVIPNGVTSIGNYSFYQCNNLEKIIIPSNVTSIESSAFSYCSNLTICCKTDSTAHKYAIDNNISVKLDDDAPSITKVEGNPTEWTKKDVVLTVTAEDEGAGLAEKAYSFDNGKTWQEENTKTYTENTSNIVIKVRDAVGNIATYETINISKIFKVNIKGYEEVKVENKKYIKNIKINEKIENLKENITTKGTIKIYKGETEITDNNTKLATGMTVKITMEEQKEEYVIVVTGDVNGDGETDLNDILVINKYRLGKTTLTGANLLAGDVDGNGQADLNDILKINKYRLGKISSL